MYDTFSQDYDRFVDWPARLLIELPFIEGLLKLQGRAERILDAACGTGMHAIALAQRGYRVAGADFSAGMIARARANAAEAGVQLELATAGFGGLAEVFRRSAIFPFDALICLGNSLPHLLTLHDLSAAMQDFAACLSSGGLLLIQNRNFDAVLAQRERWMEPQAHREGDAEWLFLRFYDFQPDGLIRFNILTTKRGQKEGGWKQTATSTLLYPLRQAELVAALDRAGFEQIACYGGMSEAPFHPQTSGNLVVAARRK